MIVQLDYNVTYYNLFFVKYYEIEQFYGGENVSGYHFTFM